MADLDYLLQAAAGAAEGFSKAYIPFKQGQYANELEMQKEKRKMQDELSAKRFLMPEQEASTIRQGKALQQSTEVRNRQGGLIATTPNKVDFLPQDTTTVMNPDGTTTVVQGAVKFPPKPSKPPSEVNAKSIDSIQAQLDEVNNVHKAIKVLRTQFQSNPASLGNSIAKVVNKVGPDSLTPETASYVGLKKQLQPRVAFALIGSKQGLQGMGKSEGSEIPDLTWDQKKGQENFDRLENQLLDKKKSLLQRISKYGGTPTDNGDEVPSNGSVASSNPTQTSTYTPAQLKKMKELGVTP